MDTPFAKRPAPGRRTILAAIPLIALCMMLLALQPPQAHAAEPQGTSALAAADVAGIPSDGTQEAAGSVPDPPAIREGFYIVSLKSTGSKTAIGLAKASYAQSIRAKVSPRTASPYQRLSLVHWGNSEYSMQIANTGKYLTDAKSRVVQRTRKGAEQPVAAQRWKIAKTAKGLVITNVASGKALTSNATAKKSAYLGTARFKGARSQLFAAYRTSKLIPSGTYKIASSRTKLFLDVRNGSWKSGAGLQVHPSNGTPAQKFKIAWAGNGYYRIYMEAAGTACQAKNAKGTAASIIMAAPRKKAASQLWKPSVSDYGIVFTNKATKGVLSVAKKTPATGTRVRTAKARNTAACAWQLTGTTLNRKSLSVLRTTIENISGNGNRTLQLQDRGTGYRISAKRKAQLKSALSQAWQRGEDVSFVLVDVKTGITLSMGADRKNHGASTFKGAYVTYLFQDLIERGQVPYSSIASLTDATIGWSSNEAYMSLYNRFGSAGFRSWLNGVGLGYLANNPYPRISARELALLWAKIYSYENSGASYVGTWRRTFDHSNHSAIQEKLGGSNKVYSKPGWYPKTEGLDSLNDGAIVKTKNGPYLLAIVSNVNCYSEQWIVNDVVKALHAIHKEMPRSGI